MAHALDQEAIERITANAIRIALTNDREERDRQSQLVTQAAVAAALANQTAQVRATRKPELPPFDKNNIEYWIKRLESAYRRAEVVKPEDKFAFIESKFDHSDSKINKFLYGTHTATDWQDFLDYLRLIYGRTRKQEVQSLLNGTPRDGRRPSTLLETIKDRAGRTTMECIYKELLLKEMPPSVRQLVQSETANSTPEELAELCDVHFDQQGKLLEPGSSTNVNFVDNNSSRPPRQQQQQQQQQQQRASTSTTSFTTPFDQDETEPEVNAVRFRGGQRQSFNVSNRSASSSRGRGGNSNYNDRSSSSSARVAGSSSGSGSSSTYNKKMCSYHINYGKDAERCEGTWCPMHTRTSKPPKGQASR